MKLQLYSLSLGNKEVFKGTIFQCANYITNILDIENKKNLVQRLRNCADSEYNFCSYTVKKAGLSEENYPKFKNRFHRRRFASFAR